MGNNMVMVKSISEEEMNRKYSSIMNTYSKISNHLSFSDFSMEDLENIKNFYSYITLNSAKEMFSEGAKILAYYEMQKYVGFLNYSEEIKKAFLNQYLEILKSSYYEENDLLKLA